MRLDRLAMSLGQGLAFGTGFTTSLPGGITAFLRSDAGENLPDVQLLFIAGPLFDAKPYLAPFVKPFNDGFGCRIVVLRPQARGTIALKSADPAEAPRIAQNLLGTDHDRRKIRKAVKLFREIGAQPALRPFVKAEVLPGAARHSDAELDAAIRATAVTVHHPAGSCRMGVDEMAVVDGDVARARHARPARDRRLGVSRSGRRQHQRRRHHDRREGRRHDPREGAAGRALQFESRSIVLRYRAVIPSCCACRPAETTVFPPTMTELISALPAENT